MRTIHAVFQNDGEWFIARCLDFPVTTQGKTLAAAKKNLQEAVELYLETWRQTFSLTPRFNAVNDGKKEKPFKRFFSRIGFYTQLKQGVNEKSFCKAREKQLADELKNSRQAKARKSSVCS